MNDMISRADELVERANKSFEDGDQGSAILELAAANKIRVRLDALRELESAASWLGFVAETSGGTEGPDVSLQKAVERISRSLRRAREAIDM